MVANGKAGYPAVRINLGQLFFSSVLVSYQLFLTYEEFNNNLILIHGRQNTPWPESASELY
jgi:hypothetical protein